MSRNRILRAKAVPVFSTDPSKLRTIKEDNKQLRKLEERGGIYTAENDESLPFLPKLNEPTTRISLEKAYKSWSKQ